MIFILKKCNSNSDFNFSFLFKFFSIKVYVGKIQSLILIKYSLPNMDQFIYIFIHI